MRVGTLCAGLLTAATAVAGCGSSGGANATSGVSGLSAAECAANKAAGTITYLSPFLYAATPGIFDVFMAQKLGYFSDLCLNVNVIANGAGTQDTLVSSNRAQASGFAGADEVISEVGSGSNFVGVETIAKYGQTTIVANSKITSLKKLEGGTLGYFGALGSDELAMLKAAGVDLSKVKFVSLSNQNPAVITQGKVDAIVAAEGQQDLTLEADHIPFHEFTEEQFGLNGTAYVMVFNKTFAREHTEAVADFVRADLKALDYCMTNASACVSYMAGLAAGHDAGQLFSKASLTAGWNLNVQYIEKYGTQPLGTESVAEWTPEYNMLKEYGSLANHLSGENTNLTLPPIASTLDTSIVNGLYKGEKLIWP